jgi:SAM-dependent methyltransferase
LKEDVHVWANAEAYERYVGRWSRLVARDFLPWLGVPAGKRWLDVGCGTGELTRIILEECSPGAVKGIDPGPGFIDYAREHVTDLRAEFDTGDATALSFSDSQFDATVAGLVLNQVPRTIAAVGEMTRVTQGGGIVGAYVWDYADGMQVIRYFWAAAVARDPAAAALDQRKRYPICHPAALSELFTGAGLRGVEARPIEVPAHFRDFEDYWAPFLGGTGEAPAYAMSLPDEHRAELRARIRASLPVEAGGSIRLVARAWAVKGST